MFGTLEGEQRARVRGARFRVAPVSRPLMAISDMLDRGQKVIFERDAHGRNISGIYEKNGTKIPIDEKKRTFEVRMNLCSDPFGRPGKRP